MNLFQKKSQISKYRTLTQTLVTIAREEGLFALWKGHLTGQFLSLSYNSSQFLWFEFLTRSAFKKWPNLIETDNKKSISHFLFGGLAASFTIITNQPIDTVRTRLVTQGEPKVYNGILDAIKKVYSKEGIRGFYKGLLPAIMLVTPESAFRFGIYQYLNLHWSKLADYLNLIKKRTHLENDIGILQSSVNGSLAGVLAKSIVYPFDLAKKRLQIQGFEDARKSFGKVVKFTGLFDCFYKTIKNEGIFGIYKGYYPSMVKASISSGLIFLFYEKFTNIYRTIKAKSLNHKPL